MRAAKGGGDVTSRRDALKLAGAATLGGVAAATLTAGEAGAVTSAAAISTTNFAVLLDGVKLTKVTAFQTSSDAIEIDNVTASSGAPARYRPGNNRTTRIKITREWSNDTTFIDWYQQVVAGSTNTRLVTVVLHSPAGPEAFRFNYYDCFPSEYDGPTLAVAKNSGHAIESLTIAYETFDYKK